MFARKFRLTLRAGSQERPVPKPWLDQFFMRDFTGYRAFDATLVTGEGELEAAFAVGSEEIQARFEPWLRGRKLIPAGTGLRVQETAETAENAGQYTQTPFPRA